MQAVTEVSLTKNQAKEAVLARRARALLWHSQDNAKPHEWRSAPALDWVADPTVTLGPLEIKTFVFTVTHNF